MNEIPQTSMSLAIGVSSSDAQGNTSGPRSEPAEKVLSDLEKKDVAFQGAVSGSGLKKAASEIQTLVNEVTDKSVTFSIEDDLSRMVVAVRAVGSDEVIRQFPPEEFLTVAKFIAAQDKSNLSEDFLKGILFDTYS